MSSLSVCSVHSVVRAEAPGIPRTTGTVVPTYIVQCLRKPVLISHSAQSLGQFVTGNSDGRNP